uniref:DUF4351 domain-containing protein n=1 Tax=Candidatus Kentrum sp. SD TaxID=2126332 RepID=A0A451BHM9_9GAMM|nr:MAG: protein of unknown function (DUF4351) [Candidatus Kentron sp. SD]
MQQGMQQGEVAVLHRLLQTKFGEKFTDTYRQRIDKANINTLLDWSEQVLSAQSIDEIFR